MLIDKIDTDLKTSMKAKDTVKLNVLRMVKSAVKNKAIEAKQDTLPDPAVLEVIQKQVKQRRDSVEEFKKGGRQDLVDKESKEIEILQAYLPAQLSADELKTIVQKAIEKTGAKTKADMGKIMKEVMPQVKGRTDGKQVNQAVTQLLKS
jgi:uncharacterized protein